MSVTVRSPLVSIKMLQLQAIYT